MPDERAHEVAAAVHAQRRREEVLARVRQSGDAKAISEAADAVKRGQTVSAEFLRFMHERGDLKIDPPKEQA